jgi:hypothetical protein
LPEQRIVTRKRKIKLYMKYSCIFNKGFHFAVFVILMACAPRVVTAQVITTLAGDGMTLGNTGDGGYASFATINTPGGLLVDKKGNIFIADMSANKIRKINAYGVITTVCGYGSGGVSGDGGPATAAKVSAPMGMAMDTIGNLFFADAFNNRIRKIDTGGIISTVVGNGVPGFSGDDSSALLAKLNLPKGLTFDKYGNMYIADCNNNKVRKVTPEGIITTIAGADTTHPFFYGEGIPATDAFLYGPSDVAIAGDGTLIVADAYNTVIRRIDDSGIITTLAGKGNNPGFGGDNGVPGESRINYPVSLAVDRNGNIFFADILNNRIRKIDPSGKLSTVAGDGKSGAPHNGDGGLAVDAQINKPTCIAVDSSGNLYVGEKTHSIRYIYLNKVKEIDGNAIIFPNPCQKTSNMFLPSQYEEIATIFVLNTEGRVVSQSVAPTNMYINLSFDVAGNYTIYAVSKRGEWKGRITVL